MCGIKEIDINASGRKELSLGKEWIWKNAALNAEGDLLLDMVLPYPNIDPLRFRYCIACVVQSGDIIYR